MSEILNRNIAPELKSIQGLRLTVPKILKLDNGVEVFIFDNEQLGLSKINLVFAAGSSNDENPLTAQLTNAMLTEVTKNYNSAKLAELLDYYGSYFETGCGHDFASVSLYTLHQYLPQTLPLLSEVVLNASFNEADFVQVLDRNIQDYEINNQKVSYLARKHFAQLLFGPEHPYGKITELAHFKSLKPSELIRFHEKYYLNGTLKIYISGKFSDADFNLLNQNFGQLTVATQWEIKEDQSIVPNKELKHFVEKEGSVQNALRVGRLSIDRSDEDYNDLKFVLTLLGGYFGSRLMSNIREDKGYTYGIGAGLLSFRNRSILSISTEVRSEVAELAIEEIMKEIEKLKTEEVAPFELQLVKNYMEGILQRSYDGTFATMDRFKELELAGLNNLHVEKFIKDIKRIDSKRVMEIANRYFDHKSLIILNVGNKS